MDEKMFYDKAHWQAFTECLSKMKQSDVYRISLAYLLTLDTVTRKHITDCFDFNDGVIKIDALEKSWQTSTSLKTTRLAFNLWNGCCDDGEEYTDTEGYKVPLPSNKYAVDQIFSSSLAEYYWQAVKLRFNI